MRRPKPRQVRSTVAAAGCARGYASAMPSLTVHVGGLIPVSFGHAQKGIEITADNTTIDGYEITGPGCDDYNVSGGSWGIWASGRTGITIRNCVIKQGDYMGIFLYNCTDILIEDCVVEDFTYAGIGLLKCTDSTIQRNTVRRIGNPPGALQPVDFNAYGIFLSPEDGNATSADHLVAYNTVSYVPAWHGIDCHGGLRITFDHNTVHHCARALWLGMPATDSYVTDNLITDPLDNLPDGTDCNTAISSFSTVNCFITGNHVGNIDPKYQNIVYDSGPSTNLTESDNTRAETLP